MIDSWPLFPEPEHYRPTLSAMYSTPEYRETPLARARYVNLGTQTITCDECFANQHEAGGATPPRAKASARRTFLGGPRLNLCGTHTQLWKERDAKDCPT